MICSSSEDVVAEETRRMFGDLKGKHALDFGTGTGVTAMKLRMCGADVTTVSLSQAPAVIAQLTAEGIQALIVPDVRDEKVQLPFPENSFDVIYASAVLQEAAIDREKLMRIQREMFRVLKLNGMYVLNERVHLWRHPRFFSAGTMCRSLTDSKWSIEELHLSTDKDAESAQLLVQSIKRA
jgi:ubiquinone/menaquinone biosynthesis C-methylase UbiE